MLKAKHCKAGQQVKRETLKTAVQILSVICGKLDIPFGELQKTSDWAEQLPVASSGAFTPAALVPCNGLRYQAFFQEFGHM
jgi:hypothetical protein